MHSSIGLRCNYEFYDHSTAHLIDLVGWELMSECTVTAFIGRRSE